MGYSYQGVILVAVSVVLPLLAACAIFLRAIARARTRKGLDASDYFLYFALLMAICNTVTCIPGAVIDDMGEPLQNLTPGEKTGFMKVLFATQFFYIFSVFSVKISILLFYKSLFETKTFRRVADGVQIVLYLWIVAFFFATLFQDKPISRNWGSEGTTINFPVFYILEAVTNMALDFFILCMPLAVIRNLQIATRKKWYLAGVFWLGAFCVVSSIVRLSYFIIFKLKMDYRLRDNDFSGTAVDTVIWGVVEGCTSIIAACLPTLGPLLPGRDPTSRHASAQASYALNSGSRIRKHTSVNVINHSRESTEHFARDAIGNHFWVGVENGNTPSSGS